MKRIRIDLKKLDSSSQQPKEFSENLLKTKKSNGEKRTFTKTFYASVKLPQRANKSQDENGKFTKTFVASGKVV